MLTLYRHKNKPHKALNVVKLLFLVLGMIQINGPIYAGPITSKFSGGNGTINNPYKIADCKQLQNMSLNLAGNYILINDINCSATQVWSPIGKTAPGFTGVFNGHNYTVRNLNLNTSGRYVGLFGMTTNATIENVVLEVVGFGGGNDIGGLVGYSSAGTKILNSSVTINAGSGSGLGNAGGLVGANAGNISKSHAVGRIGFGGGSNNDGGLVGLNAGKISDSYAQVRLSFGGGSRYVGGLVGLNNGSIVNSYATGHLSFGGGHTSAGGLVGYMGSSSASVLASYYDMNTSGQSDRGKGIPKTTSEMYQQSTYRGWDFTNTWAVNIGKYYPLLIWDAGKENLLDVQNQLENFEKNHAGYYKKYGSFHGVTYNVSQGNKVTVLQTPDIWGQSLSTIGYIPWDGQNSDFSNMPVCTNDPDVCSATRTQCVHLAAFDNGITGKNIKRCVGSADKMVDQIYQVITSAKTSVDITTLEHFPNGRFLAAIRNAITWLSVNGRHVTIRVLGGVPLNTYSEDISSDVLKAHVMVGDNNFLHQLVRDIPADKAKNINVYVGSMRSCGGVLLSKCLPKIMSIPTAYRSSWNHSKIINADGQLSIVGGQNWWTNSYLVDDAIDDVNIKVEGPASLDASHFINQLWKYVCLGGNGAAKTIANSISWVNDQYGKLCLTTIPTQPATQKDNSVDVTIMGIGRLGAGMFEHKKFFGGDEPANQSEVAKNLLFKGAVSVIRIAQQNLQGLPPVLPYMFSPAQFERTNDAGNVYDILANFVLNHGDLYVVTTNYGATDADGEPYYNQSKLTELANTIKDRARILRPGLSAATMNTLLCDHLHLASIRYSTDKAWPNQHKIGNHSKVWIVDRKAYYVGSHNIYPANLQEYGDIVSGTSQTQTFIEQFWTPLWRYSQKNAISGSEISPTRCYYNQPNTKTTLKCSAKTIDGETPTVASYTGCAGMGSKPVKFMVFESGTTPKLDALVCSKYIAGLNHVDTWVNCGRGELGTINYQVSY